MHRSAAHLPQGKAWELACSTRAPSDPTACALGARLVLGIRDVLALAGLREFRLHQFPGHYGIDHRSVSSLTVADLLDMLQRDAKEDRLTQRPQALSRPKLVILDEMGYFPLDRLAAQSLVQLLSRRYGKTSLIITSNKSYGDWGDIFADQVLASAILDRLLHHSTTINIRGQRYRLREKRQAGVFHDLTAPPKEG